ncbi:MAG: hypothetical protein HUJ98_13000, partial [Bacteroidaceae bacterium]|nr:hypothetical protein [Bacteroidaceae bacterium]
DAVTANLTIGKKFTPGDVNDDGEYSILDASMVIAYILQQDPVNGIREAADVNGDGEISVLDASLVISYVLEDRPVALSTSPNRIAKQTPTESAELIIEDGKAYLAIPDASRFVAGQFELAMPDGINVSALNLVGDNASSHTLAWEEQEDGTIKAVIFSLDNCCFMGDEMIEISYDSNGICGEIVASDVQMAIIEDGSFSETSFAKAIAYAGESGIASIADGLQIYVEGHNLIIISDKEMTLPISAVDGKTNTLDVSIGRNTYSLNKGFYIINNEKLFIK